ncbi:MAG: serine protease [Candidatus Kerfeldbacteria bacterium]|nr:serine protease [Candidatus Kerfeldbacteria bacterium]
MKPRDVPTSTKAHSASATLEQLYRAESTITRPPSRSTGIVWLVGLAAVVVSVAAVVALAYAAERFPNVAWLQVFRRPSGPAERVVIRESSTTRALPEDVIAAKVVPSLGSLLRRRSSGLHPPSDQTGPVTFLTSDGVGVTVKSAVPENVQLMARTSSAGTLDISRQEADRATGLILVKGTGSSTPLAATETDRIDPWADHYVVKFDPAVGVSTLRVRLVSLRDRAISGTGLEALLESSEVVGRRIRLDRQLAADWLGAALVDHDGQLVGVVVDGGQSAGALVMSAAYLKNQLARFGRDDGLARPVLGVNYLDLSFVVSHRELPSKGAYLYGTEITKPAAVVARSPAALGGLRSRDIVTGIDALPLNELRGLAEVLAGYEPGTEATFAVLRDGREISVKVRLGDSSRQ